VLGDEHEAEDAAQAAFLVLARRAGSFRRGGDLAGWLHGIALRTALEVRRSRTVRRRREEEAATMAVREEPGGADLTERAEALGRLDAEVARLPALERQAVVLRYLEDRPQEEAARLAGCPTGTLSRRAADGLARLRERLARRGTPLGAVALAGLFTAQASGTVPATLLPSLLVAQKLAATGAAAGAAGTATLLAEGVLKAMFLTKVKLAAAVAAAALVVGAGTPLVYRAAAGDGAPAAGPAAPAAEPETAGGPEVPAPAEAQAVNGLKISLSADRRALGPGESVTLTTTLENVTDGDLNVRVGPRSGTIGKSVFERGQAFRALRPGAGGKPEAARAASVKSVVGLGPGQHFVTLPAGGKATYRMEAICSPAGGRFPGLYFGHGNSEFAFARPADGELRLRADLEVTGPPGVRDRFRYGYKCELNKAAPYWQGTVCSNEVRLTLGGDEKPAREVLGSSVSDALGWLAGVQEPDGHWDSAAHGARPADDLAATAGAALSMLGAGHTEGTGKFRENLKRALNWLVARQKDDGSFEGSDLGGMLAPLTLVEAYGMVGRASPRRGPALKAVAAVEEAAAGGAGALREQAAALVCKSAKVAGLRDYGPEARTAEAFTAVFAPDTPSSFKRARAALPAEFLNYADSVGSFMRGGAAWREFSTRMKADLLPRQEKGGKAAGSWKGLPSADSKQTGAVLATALNALSLEVYYRYLPSQHGGRAAPAGAPARAPAGAVKRKKPPAGKTWTPPPAEVF
jgi:RNA polymerase sigma factor (sigma-70 family)